MFHPKKGVFHRTIDEMKPFFDQMELIEPEAFNFLENDGKDLSIEKEAEYLKYYIKEPAANWLRKMGERIYQMRGLKFNTHALEQFTPEEMTTLKTLVTKVTTVKRRLPKTLVDQIKSIDPQTMSYKSMTFMKPDSEDLRSFLQNDHMHLANKIYYEEDTIKGIICHAWPLLHSTTEHIDVYSEEWWTLRFLAIMSVLFKFSGIALKIDILDNNTPGDDKEKFVRYSYDFYLLAGTLSMREKFTNTLCAHSTVVREIKYLNQCVMDQGNEFNRKIIPMVLTGSDAKVFGYEPLCSLTKNSLRADFKIQPYHKCLKSIFGSIAKLSTNDPFVGEVSFPSLETNKFFNDGIFTTTYKKYSRQIRINDTALIIENIIVTSPVVPFVSINPWESLILDGNAKKFERILFSTKKSQPFLSLNHRKRSWLHLIAALGHIETANVLIKCIPKENQQAFINQQDINGRTALHDAVYNNHLEMTQYLIELGAGVNIQDHRKHSIMHIAAYLAPEIAKYLLNNPKIFIDTALRTGRGSLAIDHAIICELRHVVTYFRQHAASINTVDENSPVVTCIKNVFTKTRTFVHVHKQDDVQRNITLSRDTLLRFHTEGHDLGAAYYGDTLLHHACADTLKVLLEIINSSVADGETSASCSLTITAMNLKGMTALHTACERGDIKVVRALTEQAKKMGILREYLELQDQYGNTALQHAVEAKDIDIVNYLIGVGASRNTVNAHGWGAIHRAAVHKNEAVLKILIEDNQDLDINDATQTGGLTPLHEAVVGKANPRVVKLLLENGANVNKADDIGETPAHLAARMSKCFLGTSHYTKKELDDLKEVCALICETTTYDPDIRDQNYQTPADLAHADLKSVFRKKLSSEPAPTPTTPKLLSKL